MKDIKLCTQLSGFKNGNRRQRNFAFFHYVSYAYSLSDKE